MLCSLQVHHLRGAGQFISLTLPAKLAPAIVSELTMGWGASRIRAQHFENTRSTILHELTWTSEHRSLQPATARAAPPKHFVAHLPHSIPRPAKNTFARTAMRKKKSNCAYLPWGVIWCSVLALLGCDGFVLAPCSSLSLQGRASAPASVPRFPGGRLPPDWLVTHRSRNGHSLRLSANLPLEVLSRIPENFG